jgi:hypothetical protein
MLPATSTVSVHQRYLYFLKPNCYFYVKYIFKMQETSSVESYLPASQISRSAEAVTCNK